MVRPSSMGAIYTDTSAYRRNTRIDSAVKQLTDEMNVVKTGHTDLKAVTTDLNTHIATSDNNFSIDNVNTIANLFGEAVSRLNWTISVINENKTEIHKKNSYSQVIRPIIELKYGLQKAEDDFNIDIFQFAKKNIIYFYQSNSDFDHKKITDLHPPHNSIFGELNEKFYKSTESLINDNATILSNSNRLYNCIFGLTVHGIDIHIQCIMTDVLDKTKYIIISETVCITQKMSQINSYDTIPPAFNTYLKKVQDNFNTLAKTDDYDSTLGTIYQFGPDKDFNKLLVVSSQDYPMWGGKPIAESYIPGSNIDMPAIIFNINVQLNRNYTGMSEGEIVLVQYAVGATYYTGVVKMLKIDGYDGLCYQIQSININELFPTSVSMTGDVDIQGNLNVTRYNGEKVITTDNTRKVVSFHDKIGINQHPYEVNGLLDIDNMTQQGVLDLFDTFVTQSVNTADIIQFIEYLHTKSTYYISSLFDLSGSLFDYKNQCTVFSSPIKAIIDKSDISNNIIHTDGLGDSIIESDYSFTRLQQIVKEVNQMLPQYASATDSSENVFSFTELLQTKDKKSYMTSIRAIIAGADADAGAGAGAGAATASEKRLIFTMTYLDVTNIMNDDSTGNPFLKIMDYVSREMRFMNFATLLFKDVSLVGTDDNGVMTATRDTDGSIKLRNTIKNNPYFSNRLDLLPESYIFSRISNDNNRYLINEGSPHWSDQFPQDLWSGDNNIQIVIDLIAEQNYELYANRHNSTFAVNYIWRGGRKLSFTNTIKVGGNSLLIGSGFDLNSILDQSMIVNGDNTISGNFSVNDSNNNNIFKVNNVNKTITNMYKVGIGIEEPNSMLDVKDTTINDVLNELRSGRHQYNLLNKIAAKLRESAMSTDPNTNFTENPEYSKEIIDGVYKESPDVELPEVELPDVEQTIDNYTCLYEISMNTMLVDDVVVLNHWLYSGWEGKKIGDVQDDTNQFSLNVLKTVITDILDTDLIYDNCCILCHFEFVFGWKFSRILFLKFNGKMYLLAIGTNIQDFGLRPDSNPNLTTFMNNSIRGNMMNNRIYTYMNSSIQVANEVESFNKFRRLDIEYADISMNSFILTIDTAAINNTKIKDIYLYDRPPIPDSELKALFDEFDTNGDGYLTGDEITEFGQASGQVNELNALANDNNGKISFKQISTLFKPLTHGDDQLVSDLSYNIIAKYKNFWVTYMNNKYNENMSVGGFNVITYEDLYSDFAAGIKCIVKDGTTVTLLCNELRIQDIIKSSLSVEGDARITGDLILTKKSTDGKKSIDENYVSIDPDAEFFGVGTDERFINYSDNIYSTTSNAYSARHNLHVQGSRYPMMVCDRIQENAVKINSDIPIDDVPTDAIKYFTTYTAFTAKRTSRLYTFDQIVAYSNEWTKRARQRGDTITRYNYGSDLSFEVRDSTDRSVEIGQVGMCIDSVDSNNKLRGGFGVTTVDPASDENATFETRRRNLMYVDNDSQLFVQKINLGGKVLENDGNGNLLWGGKKLLTESE